MNSIEISGVFHPQCTNCPAMKIEFVPVGFFPGWVFVRTFMCVGIISCVRQSFRIF